MIGVCYRLRRSKFQRGEVGTTEETPNAQFRAIEVPRVKITEAGRRALHRVMTQKRRLLSRRVRRK